ncbi:MAG: hypothetical protein E7331_10715 [Clostridiales bacterium]|nr:hypothetical protein [Clostridiales bacterium]
MSEEKKKKKTAFIHKLAYKKKLPHTGSSFLSKPPQLTPAVSPAGSLLFFCVRRKEAKEDRIYTQVSVQKKKPPQTGSEVTPKS